MAEKEEKYNGIILGTRPGEVEGEDSFGAYASQEISDDIESEFSIRSETRQFEDNREFRSGAVATLKTLEGVGNFVLPKAHYDNIQERPRISYSDHLSIYSDNKHRINFNPKEYPLFDKIISDELQKSRRHNAIENPRNQYYNAYEPLRQNLAVLRNAIYTQFFPDGEYNAKDPADKAKVVCIQQIAQEIAKELKRESRVNRLWNILTLNFSEDDFCTKRFGKYGLEHYGAQKLYEKIYAKQETVSINPFKWMQGSANKYDWGLSHPEFSPFCAQDMREAVFNDNRNETLEIENCAPRLSQEAVGTQQIAELLKSGEPMENISRMSVEKRKESVELGEEILRRLRDICAGKSDRAHSGAEHKVQDVQRAVLLKDLAENYLEQYNDLLLVDPSIAEDSTFERARMAIGKLGHMSMLDAMVNCDHAKLREMEHLYDDLPRDYKDVEHDVEENLLYDIEKAMGEMTKRQSKHNEKQMVNTVIINDKRSDMRDARAELAQKAMARASAKEQVGYVPSTVSAGLAAQAVQRSNQPEQLNYKPSKQDPIAPDIKDKIYSAARDSIGSLRSMMSGGVSIPSSSRNIMPQVQSTGKAVEEQRHTQRLAATKAVKSDGVNLPRSV